MFKIFNLEGLFLSKAKKIISMLLVVAMVLTVAPVSVLASAADPAYEYGSVSFSKTDYSVDTSATTDVIRIAYETGSFSVPASGAAGAVVAATPSGIPQADKGSYVNVAYAKETPSFPKVSFSITGTTPDAIPTVESTGINNAVISHVDGSPTVTTGSDGKTTTTYTWEVTSGTAVAGTDVVFTITYKLKGVSYKAYAFSHVENILVMPGWVGAIHYRQNSTAETRTRHSIIFQVQSKNMYTYMNSGSPTKTVGYVNYASGNALDGGALKGAGGNDNVSSDVDAYVSSAPNDKIAGTEVGAFIKFFDTTSDDRYNGCFSDDGNRSEPIVYIDKRNEDLRSLNMRATVQYGESASFTRFILNDITFHNKAHTYGKTDWGFTSTAAASEFSAVNLTSGSTNSSTVTTSNGFGAYAMAPITGTGPAQSTTPTTPYSLTADVYCYNDDKSRSSYVAGTVNVDFRVYDTTTLYQIWYGVTHGCAVDGSASYGSYTFNKGANPQATMYTGGWDAFLASYKAAGSVLAKPDTTQEEIDTAATDLYSKYLALTGYNATVNWEINHYIEGTTTKLIPTQTVDPKGVYGQAQPAGSVWLAYAANIEGYSLSSQSTASQNMTLSGLNTTETFNFYYKANKYNLIIDPNASETDEDVTTLELSTGEKVYENSLETGTKEFYTFKGWYYDEGNWSQPVFSDSMSEGGTRYFVMPSKGVTIYGRWEATPIDIEYVPIAEGNVLDSVFIDGDEVKFDSGTTARFNRPADLNIDGYLFVNYYLDAELTTAATFPIDFTLGVTQTPYKLYARMVDVNGKISFESNGGSAVSDINFTAGQTIQAPDAPTKKGYSFVGWFDQSLTTEYTFPRVMSSNTGFIAYAKWTPNEYKISFDLGTPETDFDTVSLPEIWGYADTEIPQDKMPATPKKFGYVFHHWELNGKRYDLKNHPTEDIVLTPYWLETDYSAFVDVTAYEKLSGNYVETSTAQVGDVITFRMTSQTNFYTGSSVFVFMYNKNFFELVNNDSAAFKLNPDSEYISGINATHIGITNDASLPWPDSLAAARNDYQAVMIAIDPQVTATNYKTAPMADGEWITEFQLRVKSTATGSGKVYMSNDWTRTPDNIMGTMFYGWSATSSEVYNTYNNVVTPDLDNAFAEITIEEGTTPDTKVTLNSNGGVYADASISKEYTGRAETEILDYEAPTKEGYTLTGWTNAADSTTVDWVDEFYYPAADVAEATYSANWKANKYQITFYKEEELSNVFYKVEGTYDSEVAAPPATPPKQGYVFKTWVNAETGEETAFPYVCKGEASFYPSYDPATDTAYTIKISYLNNQTGNITTTSRSMKGTTGYTVVINTAEGSNPNTIYLTPDTLPRVNGYEFDPDNNTLPITGVIAADGSLVLEVNYKASIVTVTLDANGGKFGDGSSTATISGEFQTIIAQEDLPENPVKDGYVFKGWEGLTIGSSKYLPNRTYSASWEPIKYTMTFDAGEGAFSDTQKTKTTEITLDSKISAPEVPSLEGYTFVGWSLNGGAAATDLGTLDKAEARTYTAVYEKTPYNVNYYIDGVIDSTRSEVKYIGDAVTIASAPEKYGYVFGGWKLENGSDAANFTMGAADVNIYGAFTAGKFDVTFDANGGFFDNDSSIKTKAVSTTFDSMIVPPSNPARAGYEFLGWAVSKDDAAAKNVVTTWPTLTTTDAVTYYAVWNATIWSYTVEFYYQDINGQYGAAAADETLTLQGQVASEVSYTAEETKAGFTLDKTNSVLSGTVSVETPLVLTVKYARNKHVLTIDVDGDKTTSDVYYGAAVTVPAAPEKEGYTFTGWSGYTEGMTMPDTDLNITATFEAKKYTITYYNDKDKTSVAYTRTDDYGSDYSVPTPSKEGYTFDKWMVVGTDADSGLAAGTTTQIPLNGAEYYATWTVNSYNIVYRANGGAWDDGNTKTFSTPYGTAQSDWEKPADPTRVGYSFDGWNMASVPATMPAGQINILAKWTQETYNVVFKDSLSEEVYSEEALTYGSMVSIPDDPTKEGYTFLYWTDADGNEVTPADTMDDIGDSGATLTYTAAWQINEHTITFIDTGDTAYEPITKNYGEAIGAVANPVKTGYSFTGWSMDIPSTMPDEDLEITANWQINQYTISFVDTGDVAYEDITKDYKAAIGTVADPVKTGYEFIGWDKDIPTIMPAENTVITAQWKIKQFTISFEVDGGTTVAPITLDYDSVIDTASINTEKTGYEFKGWALSAEATASDVVDLPTKMPAENKTYYAIWEIKQYTIEFDVDGGTPIDPITKDFGAAIDKDAIATTKEGYEFVGWDTEIPATMPAKNMTIKALWSLNQYSISFDVDGGDYIAPIVQNYGTTIDASSINPTKTGYTFNGWVDANGDAAVIPATMPASNITLKATWKVNQYTITFIVSGGTDVEPIVQAYNTEIDASAVSTEKTGYSFIGWALTENAGASDKVDLPTKMPAENKTYYAIWQINTYTVTFLDAAGEEFYSTSLEYNATIEAPAGTPDKEYYNFVGWSLTEIALGTADEPVDKSSLIDFETAAPTVIAGDMTIYPAFDRVVVTLKLIEGSTAVVETARAETPVTGYIYGLREKLKDTDLTSEYLSVEGDGRLNVVTTKYNRCGTGTKVEVIDNVTDKVVEIYYVIIFGDVNGDSAIDAADISAIDAEVAGLTAWSYDSPDNSDYDYCKILAADIAGVNDLDGDGVDDDGYVGDGVIRVVDSTSINAVVLGYAQLDQTTGKITY